MPVRQEDGGENEEDEEDEDGKEEEVDLGYETLEALLEDDDDQ